MKHIQTLACAIFTLSLSTSTFADNISQKTTHTFGLQTGGGGIEHKGKDTDGEGVGYSYLYYNYQFMPHYYAEVGLIGGGDIDDWQCKKDAQGEIECFSDDSNKFDLKADEFEFGAAVLAIKTDLQLSKRNKLYAKIGAEFYDYEFKLDGNKTIEDDGVGLLLEAGWEYRWDNGMGINTGLQYQDLGDLEMRSLNIGVSYAF